MPKTERASVLVILSSVDALLSKAQSKLTSLVNQETKTSSPDAYRVGDQFWEKIEKLRWELREKANFRSKGGS